MPHVDVVPNAAADLRALKLENPPAAAAILVALQQLKADPNFIDKLTTRGSNELGTTRLGVKRWESAQRIGNLWRFRVLDTPASAYRVVYGYHWQTRQLVVLAVVNKEDFDYDDHSTDIAKRIFEDWRQL